MFTDVRMVPSRKIKREAVTAQVRPEYGFAGSVTIIGISQRKHDYSSTDPLNPSSATSVMCVGNHTPHGKSLTHIQQGNGFIRIRRLQGRTRIEQQAPQRQILFELTSSDRLTATVAAHQVG